MNTMLKNKLESFLKDQGVGINGSRPKDLQVHNPKFYSRVFREGSLGLGESYMDGWWDCERIDELFSDMIRRNMHEPLRRSWAAKAWRWLNSLRNLGKSAPYHIGQWHYDLGNGFYYAMLGCTMVYSCGYWKSAGDLDQAQIEKMDLICRKLKLKSGQRILDIGCGWGTLARYASENYGVRVVGVTVSKEQAKHARILSLGLPVDIHYKDYRKMEGRFDHIVSVGMFEHVGSKNYGEFMRHVRRLLKPEGLFLLHTIGCLKTTQGSDPWLLKYIFPGSKIPSLRQIAQAAEGQFVLEDLHNFGADYDRTLMAWYRNFEFVCTTEKPKIDRRFYRMWRYYLLSCAALFRTRQLQLWQIVFSGPGVENGYRPVR